MKRRITILLGECINSAAKRMNQFEKMQQLKRNIQNDFEELVRSYPFSSIVFFSDISKYVACIISVAASVELIKAVNGKEKDFTGDYSKKIYLFIPCDYKVFGCQVYGYGWIDLNCITNADKHFFVDTVDIGRGIIKKQFQKFLLTPFGYRMCVGVPESFSRLKNVLLESIKTADNLLTAYEMIMRGLRNSLAVHSYSHGNLGRKEYVDEKLM